MVNNVLNRNRKKVSIPKLTKADGTKLVEPEAIANEFNKYFCSIAENLKRNIMCATSASGPNLDQPHYMQNLRGSLQSSLYLKHVSPAEVEQIIANFKNKATSDTKINALKAASNSQAFNKVVAAIINNSFRDGIFPNTLKMAKMVPIHKSGAKTDVTNYRPISLLSSFSKIFEKAMHKRVACFLDHHNAIFANQYGFRSGHSCEHALLSAQKAVTDILDRKEIALLLLIDFSKAFDMVDHNILLDKLQHYGIRGLAHTWFKSYLSNRKQYVSINNKNSNTGSLKHGVPQGSILGPLLFIIYINDLPNIQNLLTFVLYADDANIIISGKTLHEIQLKFAALSDSLVRWVSTNGLSLNVRKTNYMLFSNKKLDLGGLALTINSIPINKQEVSRFLGVLVDDRLTWKKHIVALSKKLNCNVGILTKLKGIFPQSVLKTLYHSFIQSHMNYCSLLWGLGCKSSLHPIFVAQKKAIRVISPGFVRYWYDKKTAQTPSHTKTYFSDLELPNVYTVILLNVLTFMQKVHTDKAPQSIVNLFASGNKTIPKTCYNYFNIAPARLKCQTNSIFYEGPRLFNDILPELVEYSNRTFATTSNPVNHPVLKSKNIASFKRCMKTYLLSIQGRGDTELWEFSNFRLYKGSRSSNRNKNGSLSRAEVYISETHTLRRDCLTVLDD